MHGLPEGGQMNDEHEVQYEEEGSLDEGEGHAKRCRQVGAAWHSLATA